MFLGAHVQASFKRKARSEIRTRALPTTPKVLPTELPGMVVKEIECFIDYPGLDNW